MLNKFVSQGIVVVGGQWGDEGKGRIVDALAENCHVIVRFQGGNNAGHSLHIGDKSVVLHLIPCGIMREGKVVIIGNGVVIDPEVLFEEMALLGRHGISCTPNNLRIAQNAHIILPFHKLIDQARESKKESHIGTTKRGIGPCYEDKVARFGIVANDLLHQDRLHKRLKTLLADRPLEAFDLNLDELMFEGSQFGARLQPFLCDTGAIIADYLAQGKRVLFEGAQGTLLDVDHGSYPFVTSSNCVAAQASIGAGIGMKWLDEVLLVSKAYCTRVGEGPFFTEASPDEQDVFRKLGNEFGATTGRPRRCGYLDLTALKYAVRVNGATGLVLTKVDILCGLGPIKIATSYSHDGRRNLSFLDALDLHARGIDFEVNYQELPAIGRIPEEAQNLSDLPAGLQELCSTIERAIGIPIRMISYGPKRGQEFFVDTELTANTKNFRPESLLPHGQ